MDSELTNTKALLAKFGISDLGYDERDVAALLNQVCEAQEQFGLIRLKIGALLIAVREKELWRGRAASFREYLESEHIKPAAAKQYMEVAEKFLFELKLTDQEIASISKCSMTTLVIASQKINRHNREVIIGILENLSDKDAKHALDDFEAYTAPISTATTASPKVKKLVGNYFDLPADVRAEFLSAIGLSEYKFVPFHAAQKAEQHKVH